jgi:uncharacterized RDD family membrane protein YckC
MHPGHVNALEFAPLGAEHTNWYSVLVFAAYISLSVYVSNGWTLGKRALGIRVVSTVNERMTLWQSVERALGYGVSAAELGLGFLQYFVAPNCRTTHDRIADTVVIDTRRPRAEPTAPPTGDQPSRERVAPS